MTRRTYRQRTRRTPPIRAPRKGTLAVASALYILGLFGVLGWLEIPQVYATTALAIAGGLLIAGALLRDL